MNVSSKKYNILNNRKKRNNFNIKDLLNLPKVANRTQTFFKYEDLANKNTSNFSKNFKLKVKKNKTIFHKKVYNKIIGKNYFVIKLPVLKLLKKFDMKNN